VAEDVNAQMPVWVAGRMAEALNQHGKAVKGAKVFVLGAAYKADVGDLRESPSIRIMQQLHKRGAKVSFHDPWVENIQLNGSNVRRSALTTEAVARADLVAVLTPHSVYDLEWVAEHARLVFDARNAVQGPKRPNVVKL